MVGFALSRAAGAMTCVARSRGLREMRPKDQIVAGQGTVRRRLMLRVWSGSAEPIKGVAECGPSVTEDDAVWSWAIKICLMFCVMLSGCCLVRKFVMSALRFGRASMLACALHLRDRKVVAKADPV